MQRVERALQPEDCCELLPWDTQFWGFPIAHVLGKTLTVERALEVDRWCQDHQVRCLYFLACADDSRSSSAAHEAGFRFVDVRVTLTRSPARSTQHDASPYGGSCIRDFVRSDLSDLKLIARTGHTDSRFYFDEKFPRPGCALLYETWLTRSCERLAQQVFVADLDSHPKGYITCQLDAPGTPGRIGLLGVSREARGLGIGGALIAAALSWFAERGTPEVCVITQARNVAAQRLYQRAGFRTGSAEVWFHKWYTRNKAPGV